MACAEQSCSILNFLRACGGQPDDHAIALGVGCSVEDVPGCLALLNAAGLITINRTIEVAT